MVKVMYIMTNKELKELGEEVGIMFRSLKDTVDYMVETGLKPIEQYIYKVAPLNEYKRFVAPDSNIVRFKGEYKIIEKIRLREVCEQDKDNYALISLNRLLINPELYNGDLDELADNIWILMMGVEAGNNIHVQDYFVRETKKLMDTDYPEFNTDSFKSMHYMIKETLIRNDKTNKYRVKYILEEKDKEIRNIYLDYLIRDDKHGFYLAELFKECEETDFREYIMVKLTLGGYLEAIWDLCNSVEEYDKLATIFHGLDAKVKCGFSEYILPFGKVIQKILTYADKYNLDSCINKAKNTILLYKTTHRKEVVGFISLLILSDNNYYTFPGTIKFFVNNLRELDNECYHSADLIGTENINKDNAASLLGHVLAKSDNEDLRNKALNKMKKYD